MSMSKLVGLLGMCRRAGRLTTGFDAVVAVCNEPGVLLLTAADASDRTAKELHFHAKSAPVYRLPLSKEEIAGAVGSRKPVACLAVLDNGFANAIYHLLITKEEFHYDD